MAREPYNDEPGSDYQFYDEQEGAPEYNYEEQPSSNSPKKGKKPPKPAKIVIGIIVALVILYVLYRIFAAGGESTPPINQDVTTQQPPQQTQQQKPKTSADNQQALQSSMAQAEKQQASQEEQQIAQTNKQHMQQLSSSLKQIKQLNQDLANKIEKQQFQNQTDIESLKQSVSNINSQMQSVSKHVQALSSAFYQQLKEQRKQEYRKATEKKRAAHAIRKKKQYFVDAVIPGRAWLKGADGSTLTVTVGDQLPGYGKVKSINPYSGVVKTIHGTIPYGGSAN